MFKTSFFFLALLCLSCFVQGQHVLNKQFNSPRASDIIVKQRVEYKDPGRCGANVLWNFSKLKTLDDSYTLAYSQVGDSIVGTEHRTNYYYTLRGDSLLLNGYQNPTTWVKNVRPELLLKYPVQFGDSLTSYYQGYGKYSNELLLQTMGVATVKTDAYGMMIMPGGDTLKNVLRVHTHKRLTDKTDGLYKWNFVHLLSLPPVNTDSIDFRLENDSAVWEIETLRWYEGGYRYPIFETMRSVIVKNGSVKELFNMSFFYPPQVHYYLNDDPDNLAVLEEDESKDHNQGGDCEDDNLPGEDILNYNLHSDLNSNTTTLEFHLEQGAEVSIYLYDMQGRILVTHPKEYYSSGYYSRTIDLPDSGMKQFLLRIIVNEKSYTEKLVKR